MPEQEELDIRGLDGDEEGRRIVAEELRLLEVVLRTLGPEPKVGSVPPSARAEQLADDDKRMLELRDEAATAKPEDLPALFEQMHHLGALRATRGKTATGSVDRKSPYFAHLRLEETVNGAERRRDILIGSRQYLDSAAGIRIVDWRNAPVSRIFYRYRESDPYEETLGDRPVEGTVLVRRTVAIMDGVLRKVTAPQGTFVRDADGSWRRAEEHIARLRLPSKGGGGTVSVRPSSGPTKASVDRLLPAIAAMLDKAQYELITKPGAGLVAIQGSAGSGKTTVGLHRVAYLHATNPNRFRAPKMLVIVPNEALIHYTGRVLPSLGVEGVPVMTFARWSVRVVHAIFPKLPTMISDETPPLVSRFKNHPAMLASIDALAADVMDRLDAKVDAAMTQWPEGERVKRAWRGAKGVPDKRVTMLGQWVAGKREIDDAGPANTLPDVTKSAAIALGSELRSEARAVLHAWDEVTTSRPRLEKYFAPFFGSGQLEQIHEWCVRQARVRAEHDRDGDHPSLDSEDHALLLRLFQVLRGNLVDIEGAPLVFSHLFVDEVQDASPIELKVMLGIVDGPITLAGDVAQRMQSDDEEHASFDWSATLKELGADAAAIEPLKVSYRSTAEITSFARGVLGPFAHEAEPIATRHGPPVETFPFASAGEAVAFLADALRELSGIEPDANVALLSRFPQLADVYYEGLLRAEVPFVRRVKRQDFTWERGFDVTDVRQTKGLEFDEVILLETTEASYPDAPQARHALYVGATRAAHQLWCVTSGTTSKLVEEGLAAQAAAMAAT